MTARADNPQGMRPTAAPAAPFFALGAAYVVAPGATVGQLLGDASALLRSAAAAHAAQELADDAQFAVLHLMRQASGLAGLAVAMQGAGAVRLAEPAEFFSLGAAYLVSAGAELSALVGDAHALASSALGVHDGAELKADAEFAVHHLLHQACRVLTAAQTLIERAELAATKTEGNAQ